MRRSREAGWASADCLVPASLPTKMLSPTKASTMTLHTTQTLRRHGFAAGGHLDELLISQIRRADKFLSRAFHQVTADHDLKSGAISSLALILANPGISQSELAEEIGKDKARIVAIIDTLEARGFAQRAQSAPDRRRRALYGTPEGHRFLDSLIAEVKALEERMLALVPPDDLERLQVILGRITESCAREGAP